MPMNTRKITKRTGIRNITDFNNQPSTMHPSNKEKIPNQWKEALITPLLKKGDRGKASNYRLYP
jgi:hypothetical protein